MEDDEYGVDKGTPNLSGAGLLIIYVILGFCLGFIIGSFRHIN